MIAKSSPHKTRHGTSNQKKGTSLFLVCCYSMDTRQDFSCRAYSHHCCSPAQSLVLLLLHERESDTVSALKKMVSSFMMVGMRLQQMNVNLMFTRCACLGALEKNPFQDSVGHRSVCKPWPLLFQSEEREKDAHHACIHCSGAPTPELRHKSSSIAACPTSP